MSLSYVEALSLFVSALQPKAVGHHQCTRVSGVLRTVLCAARIVVSGCVGNPRTPLAARACATGLPALVFEPLHLKALPGAVPTQLSRRRALGFFRGVTSALGYFDSPHISRVMHALRRVYKSEVSTKRQRKRASTIGS